MLAPVRISTGHYVSLEQRTDHRRERSFFIQTLTSGRFDWQDGTLLAKGAKCLLFWFFLYTFTQPRLCNHTCSLDIITFPGSRPRIWLRGLVTSETPVLIWTEAMCPKEHSRPVRWRTEYQPLKECRICRVSPSPPTCYMWTLKKIHPFIHPSIQHVKSETDEHNFVCFQRPLKTRGGPKAHCRPGGLLEDCSGPAERITPVKNHFSQPGL